MMIKVFDCLRRERDISIKPMLSGGKMVSGVETNILFRCIPASRQTFQENPRCNRREAKRCQEIHKFKKSAIVVNEKQ